MSCTEITVIVALGMFLSPLISQSKIVHTLSDQQDIILYKDYKNDHRYYYQPFNLRLATNQSGPEFSYLTYNTTGDSEKPNAVIVHMLLTWGLDRDQNIEVEQWIKTQLDSQSILVGSIPVTHSNKGHLEIVGPSELSGILSRSLTSGSTAPLIPGSKMALSFNVKNKEFDKLEKALDDSDEIKRILFRIYLKTLNGLIQGAVNEIILEVTFYDLLKDVL